MSITHTSIEPGNLYCGAQRLVIAGQPADIEAAYAVAREELWRCAALRDEYTAEGIAWDDHKLAWIVDYEDASKAISFLTEHAGCHCDVVRTPRVWRVNLTAQGTEHIEYVRAWGESEAFSRARMALRERTGAQDIRQLSAAKEG